MNKHSNCGSSAIKSTEQSMLDKSSSWFFSIKWRKYVQKTNEKWDIEMKKERKEFFFLLSKDNNIIQMSASGFFLFILFHFCVCACWTDSTVGWKTKKNEYIYFLYLVSFVKFFPSLSTITISLFLFFCRRNSVNKQTKIYLFFFHCKSIIWYLQSKK